MSKRCVLGSESAAYRDELGEYVRINATVRMDADPLSTAWIQYLGWVQDETGLEMRPVVQKEQTACGDVKGILREHSTADQPAAEIRKTWPSTITRRDPGRSVLASSALGEKK